MREIKFRICHEAGGCKSIIYPCDAHDFLISADGTIFENYGGPDKPFWENVFDADLSIWSRILFNAS